MWSEFYQFRADELFRMWNQKLNVPEKFKDVWLPQTVARLALESIIKTKYPLNMTETAPQLQLDGDELNALRYAAGYVLLSVKKT